MKKFTLFFIALVACFFAGVECISAATAGGLKKASPKLPEFVTSGDGGTYYYVKFLRNEKVMSVSSDNCIRLYAGSGESSQQWRLVGSQNNFQFQNKDGQYIVVSSQSVSATDGGATNPNPLRPSTAEQPGGFKLQVAPNTDNGTGWEIVANSKSGNNVVNLWGDPGNGNSIGFWKTNDQNNVVVFVKPDSDLGAADYKTVGSMTFKPENKLTLWYTEPATTAQLYSGGQGYSNWMEYALPIGDGQFGACLFGGVYKDEIQFNEKTLWSGTPARSSQGGKGYGKYENFGSIYAKDLSGEFGLTTDKAASDYVRLLDLTTATGKTMFKSAAGVEYTREYIASNPARVVVAHYTASKGGKLSFRFTMAAGSITADPTYADGEGTFSGKLETISYNARMKVIPTGGTMTTDEEGIEVIGADEIMVVLGGGTDFDAYESTYTKNTSALAQTIADRVAAAAEKSWADLYAEHVADYQSFFGRCDFDLAGTKNDMATNRLIDAYSGGTGADALMLEQLYFAYGRYLEISSSRGVDSPSNLQGIWNNINGVAWNSDIHSNINVQMNYWPAEPTNLSEMHMPFLNYIWAMAEKQPQWKQWAKLQGQDRGWTCFTENNIFGGVSAFKNNYVIANAWYATHLWQHYRYTLDREYLKRVFPAMLSASQFWMDRLKLASDGTYECPNEWSPEHGPESENGVAHAQQLVYDLFSNTLAAIDVLGDDAEVSATDLGILRDRFAKLDKGLATENYTGYFGTAIPTGSKILREWKYSSYTRGENGHRHMSHLMCLYPFSQIEPGTELFDAAVNSMKLRGDGATGWSMGWKMNLWARALDGDHARKILNNALAHSNGGAGVFYNLFDSHAPFQIDGNFGACAGIAEMIMQSNSGLIRILPALPSAWTEGHMRGMKAVGDVTVSIDWKNGEATRVELTNNQGQTMRVHYKNLAKAKVYVDNVLTEVAVKDNVATLTGANGSVVVLDFDGSFTPTGIDAVKTEAAHDGYIYNVSGQRVNDSYKGLIIKNGKKMLKK